MGKYTHVGIDFRGQFCYIEVYTEPYASLDFPPPGFPEPREEFLGRLSKPPFHLCRLRYFGNEERWSMAFYTYSHMTYEPSFFDNGTFYGTAEEGFATSAVYLQD